MQNDSMRREIEKDLAKVLYAQDPIAFVTHWLSIAALSAVYFRAIPQQGLFTAWIVFYSIANCGGIALWACNRYWSRVFGPRQWINLHALRSVVLYSAPGLSIWFAFHSQQADLPILHTVLLVTLAAGVFMSSGFDLCNFSSAIPLLLMPAIVLNFSSPTRDRIVIGVVLVAFFIAMNVYAARYRKLFRRVVEARVNQQVLAESLAIQQRVTEEASRARTRFFAAASHDLRQPLHAIGLLAESLKDTLASVTLRSETADSIIANVESLNGLFNQVLDLARLESGVTQVIPLHFRLSEIFARIDNQYRPLAAAKGLALRIAPTDAVAFTDPVLLERVLGNLISNAVRYTARGAIWMGYRSSGGQAIGRIEVRDSGIGIAPEEQELVFEEFYQARLPDGKPREGHGLGLPTVRRLANLLGGDVTLRSAPGRGTTVCVPVKRGDAALITARLSDAASAGPTAAGRRILCIDDDPAILAALERLLGRWGCIVRSVRDERAAVQAVEEDFVPDALLCDYQLGNHRTGAQAVRAVRQALWERGDGDIVTLMITGDMASSELSTLAAQGIPVLHKPVTPARLRRTLDALWQQSERNAELERHPPAS
ncbi:ATP-binding response regulator [Caballeronia sp. DA-9]|uniref:ATP-binding response regulator n=1 Tax=Caballeronia sp. DA-9 TaxID=3436237 RepID=UPI003F6724BB